MVDLLGLPVTGNLHKSCCAKGTVAEDHRLNMELDLQSLFGLLCTLTALLID
jgi:hypothetical protein